MDETPTPSQPEDEERSRLAVEDEPALDPEWPSPSPRVRPPFRRRAEGKWVAGVAGGLADHWGVPALALRIPLAIAAFVATVVLWNVLTEDGGTIDPSDGIGGLIVVGSVVASAAYVVLWIVVPREDVGRSPAGRFGDRYPGIRSVPGFVLLAIGGAILADRLGLWQPDLFVAAGLIALGIWLFRRDRLSPSDVRVVEQRPVEPGSETATGFAGAAAPASARPIRPPRERSPLGWIVFGLALLVVCVAAIWSSLAGDTLSTIHRAVGLSRISTIPAFGLLVFAAGLLVGSVFGRARWLIVPAALVVPALLLTSVVRLPLEGSFGDTYLRPGIPADNDVLVRRNAFGSVYVDLGRLRGASDVVRELELGTVAGSVTVVVPFDAHVRLDAFTGLGTIALGPRSEYGVEISEAAMLEPRYGDGATVIVRAEVGLGNVNVLRYSPTKRQLHRLRREERRAERAERPADEGGAA
jgi:phage shock protein PspC (stress-responsive transcriptional regulator)